MQCSNCGYENRDGSKYCNQCGLPLVYVGKSNEKISLGGYDQFNHPHVKNMTGLSPRDKGFQFNASQDKSSGNATVDEEILDRDHPKIRKKRGSSVLKMTLVIILGVFVFFGFNGIRYAMNAQEQRVTQAELIQKQQAEAEELQRLENYREKFNVVVTAYETQGQLIQENIDKITTLRLNRFAKNLGLGNLFNKAVNTVFDVSQVNELKISNETLNVLVEELVNPPETFATKLKSLQNLQNLENVITEKMQGELSSETKKELLKLHEEYTSLLTNIKR